MFRYGFWMRLFLALALVALLTAGGYGVYRLGFAQGYQSAALSAQPGSGSGAGPAPFYGAPFHGFYPGFGFPIFFPFFGFGFFILIFFLIGGLFRFLWWGPRRWRGGPGGWGDRPESQPGAPSQEQK